MRNWFSRLFSILLLAVTVAAVSHDATAQVPYFAKGTAVIDGEGKVSGMGNATHLGRYAETGQVVILGSEVWGCLTYEAANGDKLKAIVCGTIAGAAVVGTVKYVGGTGRFANAVGESVLTGQFVGPGVVVVTVAGIIKY